LHTHEPNFSARNSNFHYVRTQVASGRDMEQNQKQYQGPERRKSQTQYHGNERRRSLDWPFKPLSPGQRKEGIAPTTTPGRADVEP
jgi:hypothetical protein